jgi:hypothetical protein
MEVHKVTHTHMVANISRIEKRIKGERSSSRNLHSQHLQLADSNWAFQSKRIRVWKGVGGGVEVLGMSVVKVSEGVAETL